MLAVNGIGLIVLMIILFGIIIESFSYLKLKSLEKELEEECSGLSQKIFDQKELLDKIDNVISEKQQSYESLLNDLVNKYDKAKTDYKKSYISVMEDCVKEYLNKKKKQEKDIEKSKEELEILRKSYQSRIEVAKREQEDKDKRNYYRWQLADAAIEDIKRIQSVKSSLSSPEIVDKILWKTYYEKATNDLITRVIGNSIPCGIYKITNLLNEKVYIGQSVNLKDRVRQHAKSGTGAATATNNKLYTSMKQDGLWNFTWEVIEECPREKLNEREAFWIDFYDAAGYGLNSTRGNGV